MSGYGYYRFPAYVTVTAHSAEEAAAEIESLTLPDTIAITKMDAHDLKRPHEYDFFPIQDEKIDSMWTCAECEESLLENGIFVSALTGSDRRVTFNRGNPDEAEWTAHEDFGDKAYSVALCCGNCNDQLPLAQALSICRYLNHTLYTVTAMPVEGEEH